ncbi:MAG: hypothetical protein ABSH02_19550 [Candidatus Sulfotelmatobacter sp.]
MSEFLSYLGWFQVVLLVISLMSGILSLIREAVLIRQPEKAKDHYLLWRCVFIAFIVSSLWLWMDEHSKLLAEHKRHEAQLDFTFSTEGTASLTSDPSSNAVFFIAGNIANSGEMPSIVRTWSLDIDLPDGTHVSPKVMLFSKKFTDVSGETAQHIWGDKFDLADDYLPDVATRTSITAGGGMPGFIMFEATNAPASKFDGVVLRYNLCYEDINHHRSCTQTIALGANNPLYAFPGMHRK